MRKCKHGYHGTPLYHVWKSMKARCNNKNNKYFHRYGGRSIKVCSAWINFSSFKSWALDNGYKENLTIDRINNDGIYCPENCRFVTPIENYKNKSNSKIWNIKGNVFDSITNAAQYFNVSVSTIYFWCHGQKLQNGKFYPPKKNCYSIKKYK